MPTSEGCCQKYWEKTYKVLNKGQAINSAYLSYPPSEEQRAQSDQAELLLASSTQIFFQYYQKSK